jgi:hypothetical protein
MRLLLSKGTKKDPFWVNKLLRGALSGAPGVRASTRVGVNAALHSFRFAFRRCIEVTS